MLHGLMKSHGASRLPDYRVQNAPDAGLALNAAFEVHLGALDNPRQKASRDEQEEDTEPVTADAVPASPVCQPPDPTQELLPLVLPVDALTIDSALPMDQGLRPTSRTKDEPPWPEGPVPSDTGTPSAPGDHDRPKNAEQSSSPRQPGADGQRREARAFHGWHDAIPAAPAALTHGLPMTEAADTTSGNVSAKQEAQSPASQMITAPQNASGSDIPANPNPSEARLPPVQQLLTQLAAPLASTRLGMAIGQGVTRMDGEVKVLRLKLKPEALGEVDVTLRRGATGMRVEIMVMKEAAAEVLQGDLGILKERIVALLASEQNQTVTVTLQQPEPARLHQSHGSAAQGGLSFGGGGDRQTPRKQDDPTRMARGDRHETDVSLQPASAGLVV